MSRAAARSLLLFGLSSREEKELLSPLTAGRLGGAEVAVERGEGVKPGNEHQPTAAQRFRRFIPVACVRLCLKLGTQADVWTDFIVRRGVKTFPRTFLKLCPDEQIQTNFTLPPLGVD